MSSRSPRRWLLMGSGIAGALLILLVAWQIWFDRSSEQLLALAQSAILRNEFDAAEELALQIPQDDPLWAKGQFVAAEAATRAERFSDAIRYYKAIPPSSDSGLTALAMLGELYRTTGQLTLAVDAFQHVLESDIENDAVRTRLTFLLGATARKWSLTPHYLALIQQNAWTLELLVLFADLERPHEQGDFLNDCLGQSPDDAFVRLGLAAQAVYEGKTSEGQRQLEALIVQEPELIAAQALLGEILVSGDESAFLTWHGKLSKSADGNPDIWYVRGLWCRRQGELKSAARCFWEAISRAPGHRRATYHLGQTLESLGEAPAREILARASALSELTQTLDIVLRSGGRDERAMRKATEILHSAGRNWEAWAWATTANEQFPNANWPDEILSDVASVVQQSSSQTAESADLARKHDYSKLPLPDSWNSSVATVASNASSASIRFDDKASESGVQFRYVNGDVDLEKPGARMFEQTGGGVAVIDFDADGSPDLFFPQGGDWPIGSPVPDPVGALTDRLFQNIDGRRFEDITSHSGILDQGFGQGIAVGDFDNDGFADLYVANIGRNRLYQNNGDGTFSDITESSRLKLSDWTTSSLIVDLNLDGHPDLFDVNYVDGPNVFELICNGYGCSPKNFDGVSDRLLISQGDGTFKHIAGATPDKDSKGLGVVAIGLADQPRPSLFISNDQVPNFFLKNSQTESPPGFRFENEAFFTGLAYNEDGLAMACMGVAVGDADGNGLPDLFVTNFRDESNTLYLQDTAGLFVDSTKGAGLTGPSVPYVGWGTQFLDADLDGRDDIVVVNGHVDDYRSQQKGYHMPAQFFRNTGHGRFTELEAKSAGSFFSRKYLGRGLARLDWNLDGRMDFVVSNMNQPATLATNRTQKPGGFINVRLRATMSARDAIGAVVRVTTKSAEQSKQLIGGDGYMASNERILQFGLADAQQIQKVLIEWPSGGTTTLESLPANVTIDVVENVPTATLWRGRQVESVEIP